MRSAPSWKTPPGDDADDAPAASDQRAGIVQSSLSVPTRTSITFPPGARAVSSSSVKAETRSQEQVRSDGAWKSSWVGTAPNPWTDAPPGM